MEKAQNDRQGSEMKMKDRRAQSVSCVVSEL